MNLDPALVPRIKQLLAQHPDAGILPQLADADLEEIAQSAAAEPIRVAQARWMPTASLVWNMDNLRPGLRKRLEDELVRRALRLGSDLGPAPAPIPEAGSPSEKDEPGDDAPRSSPETAPPAGDAPATPEPSRIQSQPPPQKEDWFDRFLTFMVHLLR